MGAENLSKNNADVTLQDEVIADGPVATDRVKKSAGAFRTISEVADELDVQQHVLRFWETKFSQVRPLKRGGGRRYYRPEDVALLKKIHELLYAQGYTIKGVQKLLRENGKNALLQADFSTGVAVIQPKIVAPPANSDKEDVQAGMSAEQVTLLEAALTELKDIRALMKAE